MFTDIAVEHNQWIIVPFDVTANYHEFAWLGISDCSLLKPGNIVHFWCSCQHTELFRFELGDNTISFKVDGVPYRTVDIQHHHDVQASIWSASFQEFVSDAWPHDVSCCYNKFGLDAKRSRKSPSTDTETSSAAVLVRKWAKVWGQSSQDPGEGIPEFQNALGLLDSIPNGFPRYAEVIM